MRILASALLIIFTQSACAQAPKKTLEDFNRSPAWENSSGELLDDQNLVAHFEGKAFVCRKAPDYTPKETQTAAQRFAELITFSNTGDQERDFWLDAANKQKRESLLTSALNAGSWKAAYLDSLWTIRFPRDAEAAQKASSKLRELAGQGIPIVVFKYSTFHFGRDGATHYRLLAEAIERGSPDAMALVGSTIVTQSKALRPLAKPMLECAVSQGNADAYKALGMLADMEGRRLDAYRLWERGANQGCGGCIQRLENIAKVRPGYKVSTPFGDLMPELVAIRRFYGSNFFHDLSHLPDFERPLPEELAFRPSDAELLKLLELEQQMRAM